MNTLFKDLPLAKVKREYKEQFKTEEPNDIIDYESNNIKDEPIDYDGIGQGDVDNDGKFSHRLLYYWTRIFI